MQKMLLGLGLYIIVLGQGLRELLALATARRRAGNDDQGIIAQQR